MAPTATERSNIDPVAATNPPTGNTKLVKNKKEASNPPLLDLYSGSQASTAATDEALRSDIISGLRGTQTYLIPGDVDNEEDRKFAFRR